MQYNENPVADLLGIPAWYLIAGVACELMGVLGLSIPAVVNLEEDMRAGQLPAEPALAEVP